PRFPYTTLFRSKSQNRSSDHPHVPRPRSFIQGRQRLFVKALINVFFWLGHRRLHQTGGLAQFNNRADAFDVDPAAWSEAESGTDALLVSFLGPGSIIFVLGQQEL